MTYRVYAIAEWAESDVIVIPVGLCLPPWE